jgi:RNA polymerase nonessential primary-like sigma factor
VREATLEQLAFELGITRERVRQIQKRATKKLRRILRRQGHKVAKEDEE